MKKIIIMLLGIAMSATAAKAQDNKLSATSTSTTKTADPDAGKFKFKEETHDYGEVPEGPFAECDFKFTNTGDKPIIITEAHGSCGCTVPEWPHDPILPGKKGMIHVKYNTTGRQGPISKDVIITSNAQQSPMTLHITGTVKPAVANIANK
jgi:hypothetical protein